MNSECIYSKVVASFFPFVLELAHCVKDVQLIMVYCKQIIKCQGIVSENL